MRDELLLSFKVWTTLEEPLPKKEPRGIGLIVRAWYISQSNHEIGLKFWRLIRDSLAQLLANLHSREMSLKKFIQGLSQPSRVRAEKRGKGEKRFLGWSHRDLRPVPGYWEDWSQSDPNFVTFALQGSLKQQVHYLGMQLHGNFRHLYFDGKML